jgi:hypothetical protein
MSLLTILVQCIDAININTWCIVVPFYYFVKTLFASFEISAKECPIKRLIEAIVLVGFVTACLLQDLHFSTFNKSDEMVSFFFLLH